MQGFSEVVTMLPQPVIIADPAYRIRYFNKAAPDFFGYEPHVLLRTNLQTIIDPECWQNVSQKAHYMLSNGKQQAKSYTLGTKVIKQDGSRVSVPVTLALIKTDKGSRDILIRFDKQPSLPTAATPSPAAQMEAAAVGSEFLHALNVLADPVVILDHKWRYHFVNQAGWDVLKRPREEVLGRNVWEFRPDLKGSEWEKAANRAMKTQKPQRIEEYYPRSKQWYITNFLPSAHYLVCHMENITALKEARDVNDQLLGTFEQAMDVYWSEENRARRHKQA